LQEKNGLKMGSTPPKVTVIFKNPASTTWNPHTVALLRTDVPEMLSISHTIGSFSYLSSDKVDTYGKIFEIYASAPLEIILTKHGNPRRPGSEGMIPIYLNENIVHQFDNSDPTILSRSLKDELSMRTPEPPIFIYRFLIVGSILHQLGHYVYGKLPQKAESFVDRRIVTRKVSMTHEHPTELPEADSAPNQGGKETIIQSDSCLTSIDPGQVVEACFFRFVSDFLATAEGKIEAFLFRQVLAARDPTQDYTFQCKRRPFATMLAMTPGQKSFQYGLLSPFEFVKTQETPPRRESPYRRVGFGILSGAYDYETLYKECAETSTPQGVERWVPAQWTQT
jgi:hypothetical protein